MEEKLETLIEYGLYDDAIILAEELNHIEKDEKWLLFIAKALFHQRFFYRCILCLNSCSSIESIILKARCYAELEMPEEAISIMERVTIETHRTGIFLKLLGDLYMKRDQFDMAKTVYIESYQKDPTLLSVRSALHNLGDVVIEEEECIQPADSLQQAIHQVGLADYSTLHHTHPPLFSSPLSLYYQFIYNHDQSNYQAAASNYMTLHDLLPWWRKGIDRYSSVLFVLKKNSVLSSLFNQTHHFEPSLKETFVIEYNHLALKGDDTSITCLSSLPSSYTYGNYLRGVEYLQRGESSLAIEAFRLALAWDSSDYRVWLGFGDCYSMKKDYEKAISHYTQCLNLFPGCLTGYCRLAQAWMHKNNVEIARKIVVKGLSYDKEYPGLLLLQAQLFKLQKRYKEAIHFFERVKTRCSLEASVYIDLAECYHEIGNLPESKRVLFLASQMDDSNQGKAVALLKKYEFD